MELMNLERVLSVLERAQSSYDGTGHWLPQKYSSDLAQAIKIVRKELHAARPRDALNQVLTKRSF